ncbi:hypothetical protein [Methylobacter sp.]|uniref:hypothetical protein n=1 Tax=Methylobacter sp. TaxID=2051955 RepID=UPI002FDE4BD4
MKRLKSPTLLLVQIDQKAGSVVPAPDKKRPDPPVLHTVDHVLDQQGSHFTDHLGYKLLTVAYQNIDDKQHAKLKFIADSIDGLKVVQFDELSRAGFTVFAHGLCKLSLIGSDGQIHKVGCESSEISKCSAKVQTATVISLRNCIKYGQKAVSKPTIPTNALVTAATSVLPD